MYTERRTEKCQAATQPRKSQPSGRGCERVGIEIWLSA
jgi:hypothetical protein